MISNIDSSKPVVLTTTVPPIVRYRLLVIVVLAIATWWLAEKTSFDVSVSYLFFDEVSRQFPEKRSWLFNTLIHDGGRDLIGLIAGLILLLMISCWIRVRSITFNVWAYVLFAMVVTTTSVASIKQVSPVHCPYKLEIFGGDNQIADPFGGAIPGQDDGHCWPAGHASGAFSLLALYFAARRLKPEYANWLLLFTAILGTVFAVGQTVRGAHFASHTLWTILIVWFENEILDMVLGGRIDQRRGRH